ncbi:hypothetical protein [Bacillus cereus]|uniref:Uncharacterized protein n=1 Tax=Bacillus cereus HuA4-10 TaxID=1053206 RepID=J8CUP8_BACCE|nr:hypothetical protein [Bacillus cereus]EJQ76406.1 hypothetical protein IGC_04316 [Bacillus cereus HuA4-10]
MEEGHMVERRKELEMVFLGGEKKITIASFGSLYPNDDELYLRDNRNEPSFFRKYEVMRLIICIFGH